jgi:hypothetical protein
MWTDEPTSAAELGIMPRLFGIAGITRDEILRQIDGTSGVVIVARATDEHLLPELLRNVRLPTTRVDRPCVGGDGRPTSYPCGITVLAWVPMPATVESPAVDRAALPKYGESWPDAGF